MLLFATEYRFSALSYLIYICLQLPYLLQKFDAKMLNRNIIVVLVFLYFNSTVSDFRLYHTEYHLNDGDHDCLYHYGSTFNRLGRHLVPYCIRSKESLTINDSLCEGTNFTFLTLNCMNVTANDLFKWYAPIDLITNYIHYVETDEGAEKIFCNCSHNKVFGSRCHYRFAFDSISLDKIVQRTFALNYFDYPHRKYQIRTLTDAILTCYMMINCTTYTDLCLDWRQICDGIRDCTNGHDEEHCLLMELNQCDTRTEYRCRNGMCIPKSFSFDLTMDCMDFYDEQEPQDVSHLCSVLSSVDCEDHSCGLAGFSCGDGSCFQDYGFSYGGNRVYEECDSQRNSLYIKHMFAYQENTTIDDRCWTHMWCLLGLSCLYEPVNMMSSCSQGVFGVASFCNVINNSHLYCPEKFFFPPTNFVLPYVQLLYERKVYINQPLAYFASPSGICYNKSVCDLSSILFFANSKLPDFQGYECFKIAFLSLMQLTQKRVGITLATLLAVAVHNVFSHCIDQSSLSTPLYQCRNRLLISPHRFSDRHVDCFPWTDEYKNEITCRENLTDRFICPDDFPRHCIHRRLLRDGKSDCATSADENFPFRCTNEFDCQYMREFDLQMGVSIIYQELCNGYQAIMMLKGTNETDETNCHEWSCKARAIRCDNVWNLPNGCDELDCPQSIPYFIAHTIANCSATEHYCLKYNRSEISCLPVNRTNDRIIDCLFGSDERVTLGIRIGTVSANPGYLLSKVPCYNQSNAFILVDQICDRRTDCLLNDDELLCPWHTKSSCSADQFTCKNGTCLPRIVRCNQRVDCPEAEDEWTCDFENRMYPVTYSSFSVEGFTSSNIDIQSVSLKRTMGDINYGDIFSCHRGILAYYNEKTLTCFCPPSYYGAQCEYQSERLSVSFKMEMLTTFNLHTIYQLVFCLLNEEENLLTVETLVYAPVVHSSKKHIITLMYPRRNQSLASFGNLTVRIDAYIVTLSTVDFSLSWLYPIQFSFFPVNRLAAQLLLEERRIDRILCARLGCIHGICQVFINTDRHFCQCLPNWTGPICDQLKKTSLNCSTVSKSIVSHGYQFCLCPLGRIGTECRVQYNACYNVTCQNGGACVSLDARTEEYICLCKENYFGDNCQYVNAYLLLHIPQSIDFIPVISIHFLHSPTQVPGVLIHRNIYFHKNIQPNSHLIIYDNNQHYLSMFLIAQLIRDSHSHYGSYFLLGILTENRTNLTTSILMSHRCPHVNERLNSTLMKFEWLKRIKFYHNYFQNVKCFYDENYMCFVDDDQLPECFHFNHGLTNCTDRNYCENNGRCLQRKRSGQLNFICVCSECVAGSFCQLKMTQFSLTLDSILGETIVTDTSWFQQSPFIRCLTIFVVFLVIVGIISNLMSCFTFVNVEIRQFGCGNYLFILSIVCQLALIAFAIRFTYLLVNQMTVINNKNLLIISCASLDFIVSFLVILCDWLTACVSCERTMNVIKGARFNKATSVRATKFVIPILIIVLLLTTIHSTFNQTLVTDPRNDARFWCVIKFRYNWLEIYTASISLFNAISPFVINLISAITLLISFSRTKQRTNTTKSYKHILVNQTRQHKDLIIGPIIMIIFKVPFIIVTLIIKCVKSNRQFYLALITYFLSLVPLTATFAIFIMPAPSYVRIFREKSKHFWTYRKS